MGNMGGKNILTDTDKRENVLLSSGWGENRLPGSFILSKADEQSEDLASVVTKNLGVDGSLGGRATTGLRMRRDRAGTTRKYDRYGKIRD